MTILNFLNTIFHELKLLCRSKLILILVGFLIAAHNGLAQFTNSQNSLIETAKPNENTFKNLIWTFSYSHPDSLNTSYFTDSTFQLRATDTKKIQSFLDKTKHGWFSTNFWVDSSLAGKPLYLIYYTENPAHIWLNGHLVLKSGLPSVLKKHESPPPFNHESVSGITLPYGMNKLIVEVSTHKKYLFVIDYSLSNVGLYIQLKSNYDSSLKTNRTLLFGGTGLLLLLLLFIHVFLTIKSVESYPIYVSLCTFFTLFNSFTTLSDTFIQWSYSYAPFFTIAFPISYLLSFFFYLIAIRKILDLQIQFSYYTTVIVLFIGSTLISLFSNNTLFLFYILAAATLLFFSVSIVSLIQAYKKNAQQRIGILAGGLIITTAGALSYVLVYILFGIRIEFLFFIAVLFSYSGIPVSLTLYVIQSYSVLFNSLEQKIEERTASLAKSIQFKNDFLSNMSHEFITPLTICKNVLHLTKQQHIPTITQQKDFDLIEDNLNRLHTMVKHLLELTQSDQSELSLKKEKLNANEFYKEITDSFFPLVKTKGLTLNTEWEPNSPFIEADKERVRIIISNLISNAIKFSSSGGNILIKTQRKSGLFYFSILDSGPGIPTGMEEIIFDRFHRIQQQTQNYVEGAGIGLELSRTLARLHQGDILADPNQRKGALFHFYLPIIDEPNSSEIQVTEPEHNPKSEHLSQPNLGKSNGFDILIVEDNPDMQETVKRILSPLGTIHTSSNGAEALSKLQHLKPDLIISDLMMPVMDGSELVKRLTENPLFKHIPILILTAKNLGEEKTELLKIGVIDYLTKPFNPEHFLLKAQNLLRLYENRKQALSSIQNEANQDDSSLNSQLKSYILEHIDDSSITIERLADHFLQSRRTLFRAIETETGMTPGEFIREIRLQKALELLQKKQSLRLDELAYAVGYKTPGGFRKAFVERFGFHPIKG